MKALLLAICALFLFSCGTDSNYYDETVLTQVNPYVSRIVPANGVAGDVVTIYGFGFSEEWANNVVSFGDASISASAYGLVPGGAAPEIETLTVTVPAGVVVGATSIIYVTVFDYTSNNNITFTVP